MRIQRLNLKFILWKLIAHFNGKENFASVIYATKRQLRYWLEQADTLDDLIPYQYAILIVFFSHGLITLSELYINPSLAIQETNRIVQPLLNQLIGHYELISAITLLDGDMYIPEWLIQTLPKYTNPSTPVICDEDRRLLAGIGRLERAKKLGAKDIKTLIIPMKQPNQALEMLPEIDKFPIFERVQVGLHIEKALSTAFPGFSQDKKSFKKDHIAAIQMGFKSKIHYDHAKYIRKHGNLNVCYDVETGTCEPFQARKIIQGSISYKKRAHIQH
jgi:hypothetical protein